MTVQIERSSDGRVETWWLSRPSARNAITLDMWSALELAALRVDADLDVRAVVIRGRGGNFSSGADIIGLGRSLAGDHAGSNYRSVNAAAEFNVAALSVPTIAAIDGYCFGGGVQLALACDLRVATARSQFAVTPAKLGIAYPASAIRRLVANVGSAVALELLLTAKTIDASRAQEVGLINRTVDDLDAGVAELCAGLLAVSPFTQAASKRVIAALLEAVDVSALGTALEAESLNHDDLIEGLAAFGQKRPAEFGRRRPLSTDPL